MKTILVITNFSNASHNAEVYAYELAKTSGAKLLLCHISGNLSGSQQEINSANTEAVEKKLNAECVFLTQLSDLKVDCLVKNFNSIDDIILLEKEGDIDLVIIGIKALAPLNDLIFKGEMRELIIRTHIPVIIIPEESNFKRIDKIAFAIDFKLEKELKMHSSIKALLYIFEPKIVILNVVKENTNINSTNKEVSENNIENYFGNLQHIYSFIENNDVIKGLKEFISDNDIDMITMLPHKHNLLGKVLVESKTRKMAFHTTIPLLLLPEG